MPTPNLDMALNNITIPYFEQAVCLGCNIMSVPRTTVDGIHKPVVGATAERIRRMLTPNQPLPGVSANNNNGNTPVSPIYALARHVIDVNLNGRDLKHFEARVSSAITRRHVYYRDLYRQSSLHRAIPRPNNSGRGNGNTTSNLPVQVPVQVPVPTRITASARTVADNQHMSSILDSLRVLGKTNDTLSLLLGVTPPVQNDIATVAGTKADKKKQLELEKIIAKNPTIDTGRLPRNIKNLLAAHRSNAFKMARVNAAKLNLTQQINFLHQLAIHTIDNVLKSSPTHGITNDNDNNSSNPQAEITLDSPIFRIAENPELLTSSSTLNPFNTAQDDAHFGVKEEPILPLPISLPIQKNNPHHDTPTATKQEPLSLTFGHDEDVDVIYNAPPSAPETSNTLPAPELSIVDELQIWASLQQHESPPIQPIQLPISLAFEGGDLAKFTTASAYNYSYNPSNATTVVDWTRANYGKTPPAA